MGLITINNKMTIKKNAEKKSSKSHPISVMAEPLRKMQDEKEPDRKIKREKFFPWN
jgi:hypothetical protein